jgi:hypothetical protein
MTEHDATSVSEWESALDRLELQLNRAERIGAVDPDDVELHLPAALSTIPRYLLDRAQMLVERHQGLVGRLPRQGDPTAESFTLHDRVGPLITGPRAPLSADFLDALNGDDPGAH